MFVWFVGVRVQSRFPYWLMGFSSLFESIVVSLPSTPFSYLFTEETSLCIWRIFHILDWVDYVLAVLCNMLLFPAHISFKLVVKYRSLYKFKFNIIGINVFCNSSMCPGSCFFFFLFPVYLYCLDWIINWFFPPSTPFCC